MSARITLSIASFWIACCLVNAQEPATPAAGVQVPLEVNASVPLRVYISHRLSMRLNEPVRAKLIEPVYAFDRIVIPSGVELTGHVSSLEPAPKMDRFQAILQGDFTPLHKAHVEFTSITMPDGRVVNIDTFASRGLGTVYEPPRPPKKKKGNQKAPSPQNPQSPGILGTAKQQAQQQVQQQISARSRGVVDLIRSRDKKEWLEDFLIHKLPYHPQWYRRNTRFDALLRSPLQLGNADISRSALQEVGLPSGECIAQVRLLTAVSSADATTDTRIEGVLTQPLFSPDNKLVLPEGTILKGRVRSVQAARWFHRGGQLRFTFDQVEPPAITAAAPLQLQRTPVQLAGVEASSGAVVKVDSEGDAKATESKTRLLGPAIALIVASRAADNDAGRNHVGSSGAEANYGGRTVGGISGFGLLGAAAGRASQTAGAALGYYGLAWSVYSTIISRGKEVEFEKNTAMEVRFGSPTNAPVHKLGSRLARADE